MTSLSTERLAELLSRLLSATRSFAYTAHYIAEAKKVSAPAIAEEERAREILPLLEQSHYGEALLASIPLEDRARRALVWEAALTEGARHVQARFRSLDAQGRTHWLHEEATIENGSIVGIFSILPAADEAPLMVEEAPTAARPRILKRANAAVRASEFEEALARDQFTLAYQLQIQPQQHLLCGAEVFVRWRHPEQGLLFPSRFLPQAEESGFIHILGQWMVEAAYRQQCAWEHAGYLVPLSLNLAGRQILHPGFAESLPVGKLRFELTEAALLQHGELLLPGIKALVEHGFTLGLDNAGVGGLTAEILERYPIHYIKVARSLVQNLETEESAQKASRVIALGNALRLEVIADGVETPQQAQQLQESGCSVLQGYLYSRPLSAEALEDVFRSGNYHLLSAELQKAA